jgi:hypothetical protein
LKACVLEGTVALVCIIRAPNFGYIIYILLLLKKRGTNLIHLRKPMVEQEIKNFIQKRKLPLDWKPVYWKEQ